MSVHSFKIVSMDKMLCFTNTLIIITILFLSQILCRLHKSSSHGTINRVPSTRKKKERKKIRKKEKKKKEKKIHTSHTYTHYYYYYYNFSHSGRETVKNDSHVKCQLQCRRKVFD